MTDPTATTPGAGFDDIEREEIAVVGMSGRFPGAADVDRLWDNLLSGGQAMEEIPPDRLAAAGVSELERTNGDYVAVQSALDDADCFDADFFGYTKREAEIMDPQHRVVLECSWSALESAGYDPATYGGRIGVFGGVAQNTYRTNVMSTRPDILAQAAGYPLLIGSEREYAITRVAYKLDLRGPAISVNTACSTSGVALHLAGQSVLSGECDMALVGGARIRAPLAAGYRYEQDGILSPDGRCRPFDAAAAGTIAASGAAMIVIKRLSDALNDGDTVLAVVKGTAVNNDGAAKTGYTAPGFDGQVAVITEALDVAEVDPATISYVEAHGTGTYVGDPIEVAALTEAYRRRGPGPDRCLLGSIKSNIGHLDAGAGVAGIIKTILAMGHGVIPPTANFTDPSPQIDFGAGPFVVSGEAEPWTADGGPRRAAVSSFGLGGTNAHVVLEEGPSVVARASGRHHHLLTLSARTPEALDRATERLATRLDASADELADVAHTLAVGRRAFPHRRTIVAADSQHAAEALRSPRSIRSGTGRVRPDRSDVAFLFPGGGAQHAGMAAALYRTEEEFRAPFEQVAELARAQENLDLTAMLFGPDALTDTDLERPSRALPALLAVEYALARLWQARGIEPTALIGHSLGEYTAACLAGVFSLADAVGIVALRGRLFDELSAGAMLSVSVGEDELTAMLGSRLGHDLAIAAANRIDSTVIAGEAEIIDETHRLLTDRGVESRRLHISVAAHSHLVEPVLARFQEYVEGVELRAPSLPFISNLSGGWAGGEVATAEYWTRHLRHTVRLVDGLGVLLDNGPATLIEVGPGQALSGYALRHPNRTGDHDVVPSLPHPADPTPDDACFLRAVGRVWANGGPVDLGSILSGETRRRVRLPTYPFERVRHWIEPGSADAASPTAQQAPPASSPAVGEGEGAAEKEVQAEQPVLAQLTTIFHELSGIEPEGLDPDLTFLELGFDSLFMTQATGAVGAAFGVRVSFRQLFEEAPTLRALADLLHQQRPTAPAATAEPSSPYQPNPGPGAAVTAPPSTDLAELGSNGPSPVGAEAGVDPSADLAAQAASGPWKPIETGGDELSGRRATALADLVERLTTASPGSKRYTVEHRAHLADPRTVAGFRRPWKELVYPIVGARSAGSRIWDIDDNEYLDIAMGFGVNLFGHSPQFVVDAVTDQLSRGFEIGPQTPLAGEVAALITELTGNERVAFCNTGSEAVLAAMRLARTVSGRTKIVTFSNDYHGLFDEVLARGVTVGGQRRSIPLAPGIPPNMSDELIVLDYGTPESLQVIEQLGPQLAAVLVEPVQSRNPTLQPAAFLRRLRDLTAASDTALIFDEMITGFRAHPGGMQHLFGVRADLATYGKVIGGGFPIGVVSGRSRYMDALDGGQWRYGDDSIPEADVTWFAGTFVRHPVAMAAAKATLTHLQAEGPGLQQGLNERTTSFVDGLNDFLTEVRAPINIEHFSSLFLTRFHQATEFASLFYFFLRDQGIHVTEGRGAFLSTAHDGDDLEFLSQAYRNAVIDMQAGGFLPTSSSVSIPASTPTTVGGHSLAPLSAGQQEIWLATQLGDDPSRGYNLANTIELAGPLDVDALQDSLHRLVERHPALRTTISADGEHQVIADQGLLPLTVTDLSDRPESEWRAGLAARQREEVDRPFDLVEGPLTRAGLVRLGPEHHVVLLTVHHIVCDGWSSGVLIDELGALYRSVRLGGDADLPPAMAFTDYVAGQHEWSNGEGRPGAESFWRSKLETPYPVTEFPPDRPRPPTKTYRAERQERRIEPELLGGLRTLAAGANQTLFTTVLGAFECYLQRLNGGSEVALGVSIAGHTRFPGVALVGHCVNLLPLRRPVDQSRMFADHLAGTQSAFLDAFDHQDYAYGSVVRNLLRTRDPSRTPLVSVVFNLDATSSAPDYGDLEARAGSTGRTFENFDVFVNLVAVDDALSIECTYNTDLFTTASMGLRLDGFLALLDDLVRSGPEQAVGALEVRSQAEIELVDGWNATDIDLGPEQTLAWVFEEQVRATPNRIAVVDDEQELTYAQLNDRANQVAHWLIEQGVGPEHRVAVMMERSVDLVVAVHAAVKAGGAYLPLDPEQPAERLAFMVREARPTATLCQHDLRTAVPDDAGPILAVDAPVGADVERLQTFPTEDPERAVDADSAAYVLYTSGSTGRPKGVINTHRGIVNRLRWVPTYLDFGPEQTVVQKTPFSFDVSVWELFGPLQVGARLVMARPGGHRDPGYLAQVIDQHQVTTAHFVPSMLRLFLEDPRVGSCASLQQVLCSGEALTPDLVHRFHQRFGPEVQLHNLYGPTEAAVDVTAWPCPPDGGVEVVPIGRPVANTRVHVLDDRLEPTPIGVVGELHIGGVQVARGYLDRPELTAERFIADPRGQGCLYRTGDLARWRLDGTVEYHGRNDDQVQIRGNRVELGEIESTLHQHPAVAAAAVAVRVDDGRQRLVAYLSWRSADAGGEADVRTFLQARLPGYMVPDLFVTHDRFELTSSGKVDRAALPAPESSGTDRPVHQAAQTPVEKELAAIWSELLGVDQVGVTDDFFALGGHSLDAVRANARVHEAFGVDLTLGRLFEHSTISSLAPYITAAMVAEEFDDDEVQRLLEELAE